MAEILELTTTDEWNYVRTSENPADAGTRGLSANFLSESHWLKGPDFLKTDDWPFQPSADGLQKIKKTSLYPTNFHRNAEKQKATAVTANVANMASNFEWQKYSSYEKLLRIVA